MAGYRYQWWDVMPTWPWDRKLAMSAPLTAFSKSASSKMRRGDLPPSSRVTGFTPSEAISIIWSVRSILVYLQSQWWGWWETWSSWRVLMFSPSFLWAHSQWKTPWRHLDVGRVTRQSPGRPAPHWRDPLGPQPQRTPLPAWLQSQGWRARAWTPWSYLFNETRKPSWIFFINHGIIADLKTIKLWLLGFDNIKI